MTKKQQAELYDILQKRLACYTKGKTSMASVESAQKVLLSMEFCMNSYYKSLEDGEPYGVNWGKEHEGTLKDSHRMEDILSYGMTAVYGCIANAKKLLDAVKETRVDIQHRLYQKTILEEVTEFFDQYDPEFAAQLLHITPAYPLAVEVTKLQGIEYMYEYLFRLYLENQFVQKFDLHAVKELISNHSEGNVYEQVLCNAISLQLIGKEVDSLILTQEDCKTVTTLLGKLSIARTQILFEERSETLLNLLDLNHSDMIVYTKESAKHISKRVTKAIRENTLSYLYRIGENSEIKADFEGNRLDQSELDEVRREMKKLSDLQDKLSLLKERIHNLNDLVVVMEDAFAGEEYESVLALLLPSELELLLKRAQERNSLCQEESLLKEWERVLLEQAKEKEI